MRNKLTTRNSQTGFTIIEVVLVLAIAGLIFLIVFLALPQLQRSRRDTQRKNDVGRYQAALSTYAGSNNGQYPTNTNFATEAWRTDFVNQYMQNEFNDPTTGSTYNYNYVGVIAQVLYGVPAQPGDYLVAGGLNCDGTGNAANTNIVVVIMILESGTYCEDNQ